MSNLDDRQLVKAVREVEARRETVEALRRKISRERGEGGVAMMAALAYGDTLNNNSLFAKMSHAATLFCIAAAGVIPVLLVVHVAF